MKILHFADAHVDRDQAGPFLPGTGLGVRAADFFQSLETIVEYVETQGVELVVFSGDAYHGCQPNPTFQREFARRIRRMASSAPVIIIVGNHDIPGAFGKAHTLEIYKALEVDQVYIVDRPRLLNIPTEAGEVQVLGIPWPTRHNVMTKEAFQGVPAKEIDKMIADAVAEKIKELAGQLDPELPAILAAHLTVEGGDMGGGTPVGLGGGISLPLEALALEQFDYVALGHLHRYQRLHDNPPVVYSGSIERIDFGEEMDQKGFVVVTMGRNNYGAYTTDEFIPLDVRDFRTIRVHLDGTDPTDAVLESIHEEQIEGAVVRVIIEGTSHSAAMLDDAVIHRALEPALRSSVVKNIDREVRMRLDGPSYEEMGPMDLLAAYLESKGTSQEEQERLVQAAEGLMVGV